MITIVSGFQRCGSSLMLQMLNAGGMPVFHDPTMGYPSFETRCTVDRADDLEWMEPLDGHALKWLEPHHTFPGRIPHECRVIWMTRNHDEQGKSAAKFCGAVSGFRLMPDAWKQFADSYRKDECAAQYLWAARAKVLIYAFESVISSPAQTAADVQEFLAVPLDTDAMARQVRPRPAECLPYMLEIELIQERELAVAR